MKAQGSAQNKGLVIYINEPIRFVDMRHSGKMVIRNFAMHSIDSTHHAESVFGYLIKKGI